MDIQVAISEIDKTMNEAEEELLASGFSETQWKLISKYVQAAIASSKLGLWQNFIDATDLAKKVI